jgi:ion channel-forming bestrophin family protein
VHNLAINNGLLTVLGTVLGLVISFRTSSAYERCVRGFWSPLRLLMVFVGTRRAGRCGRAFRLRREIWLSWCVFPFDDESFFADGGVPKIWIHVPNERKDKSQTVVHSIVEKKSMVNLTQAFSVAVKVRP